MSGISLYLLANELGVINLFLCLFDFVLEEGNGGVCSFLFLFVFLLELGALFLQFIIEDILEDGASLGRGDGLLRRICLVLFHLINHNITQRHFFLGSSGTSYFIISILAAPSELREDRLDSRLLPLVLIC